jgi:DHA3 family tetracycline resistance protein-like MFS transporter
VPRLDAYRTWLLYRGLELLGRRLTWTVAPIYFVLEIGMSPLELVLVGTAMELAYFLFEVPTGALADSYSRRASIVAGVLTVGGSFVVIGLVPNVAVILAASAVMGFGWTLRSGAEDAWLMDEIGPESVGRAYQRGAQVARVLALAGIGAGIGLALIDLRLAVMAGGAILVVLALTLVLVMPETGFTRVPRGELSRARSLASTTRDGARLIRMRPVLLLIIGITFFSGMWSEGIDRLWEAHLLIDVRVPELAGLNPVVWFGVLNGGALLLALALAQPLVPRFERAGREGMARILLAAESLLMGATLAFALAGSFALALAAFWAIQALRSLGEPVYSAWLNSNIDDSRVRATVISMTNLGDSVGQWGGGPALGGIGNAFGIRAALVAGAVALSPALALYARAIRHHGREPELAAVPVVGTPAEHV